MSESVCHVIQDVVYRTTGESGWGETVSGYEMHSLEGRLELKHLAIQSAQHTDYKKLQFEFITLFHTLLDHLTHTVSPLFPLNSFKVVQMVLFLILWQYHNGYSVSI